MTRNEALNILEKINAMYPRFELTELVIENWLPLLEKMDYKRVGSRLQEHVLSSPFPPTISEISAYAPKMDDTTNIVKQWEEEHEQVPVEIKKQFEQKMKSLLRGVKR